MINSESVKYYDRILSHILEVAIQQLDFKNMKELCNGDEDLALVIGQEFEKRGFASIAETKLEYSIILKRNGLASIFYKNGGFAAEFDRQQEILKPSKSTGEKLTDFLYSMHKNNGYIPLGEDSAEVYRMCKTLQSTGLIEKNGDFLTLSSAGYRLVEDGETFDEYKAKKHSPQPSKIEVHGNFITGSNLSNSPITSNNSNYRGVSAPTVNASKWWIPLVGAGITAAATVTAKLLELF